MKSYLFALAALAASGTALAQEPTGPWEFFGVEGGRNGASVKSADGSQFVIKCDKPGRREVHAILLTAGQKLAPPGARPISREVWFQFDSRAPKTENWGFFESHALASGTNRERALPRLLAELKGASKIKARLDATAGSDVEMEFDVTGADAAIARVFEVCQDSVPT